MEGEEEAAGENFLGEISGNLAPMFSDNPTE